MSTRRIALALAAAATAGFLLGVIGALLDEDPTDADARIFGRPDPWPPTAPDGFGRPERVERQRGAC